MSEVTEAGPKGTRFFEVWFFEEIDSTNRYLLDQAREGAPEGLVAVADHQTAGRGRLGRTWVAPPGSSLLVSVLLRPALPAEELHLANVCVALSAADACREAAGAEPGLKWPNDLVVAERKLAGVLAEVAWPAGPGRSGPEGSGPGPHGGGAGPAVVVGIGINVDWPEEIPAELAGTAVSLNHLVGRRVDRTELLVSLLRALDARCGRLEQADGRRDIADQYRARCVTVGRRVRVELPGETFTGTATDISDQGHLLVSTDAGRRTVAAGDVTHLRLA